MNFEDTTKFNLFDPLRILEEFYMILHIESYWDMIMWTNVDQCRPGPRCWWSSCCKWCPIVQRAAIPAVQRKEFRPLSEQASIRISKRSKFPFLFPKFSKSWGEISKLNIVQQHDFTQRGLHMNDFKYLACWCWKHDKSMYQSVQSSLKHHLAWLHNCAFLDSAYALHSLLSGRLEHTSQVKRSSCALAQALFTSQPLCFALPVLWIQYECSLNDVPGFTTISWSNIESI